MAHFIVTVDGNYIDTRFSKIFKDIGVLNLSSYTESAFASLLLTLPDEFDPRDFNYVFYEKTGRLGILNNYLAAFGADSKKFKGYIDIGDLGEKYKVSNNAKVVATNDNTSIRFYKIYDFKEANIVSRHVLRSKPKPGDRIHFVKREIQNNGVGEDDKIKITVKWFEFPDPEVNPFLHEEVIDKLDYAVNDEGDNISEQIISNNTFLERFSNHNLGTDPILIDFVNTDIKWYLGSVIDREFKINDKGDRFIGDRQIDVIENVVFLFNEIFSDTDFVQKIGPDKYNLRFIFDKHFEIINNIGNIYDISLYDTYLDFNYFIKLRSRLVEFNTWVKGRTWYNTPLEDKEDILTRIFGLFTPATLREIPYDKKIALLSLLLSNFYVSGRWFPTPLEYKLTEEELVIKIVQSIIRYDNQGVIVYDEINMFMDLLNNLSEIKYTDKSKTVYELLESSINFDVFFEDGKGAKGQFIKAVYDLWLLSKYNPEAVYDHGSEAKVYEYTNYNAITNIKESKKVDKNAAPYIVPYQSEKKSLWYSDNMTFIIVGEKIQVKYNDPAELLIPLKTRIEVERDSYLSIHPVPFGEYDIFQPVGVSNMNENDLATKVPVSRGDYEKLANGTISNVCDLESSNNLPIFYLKYIDDLGDKQDGEESLFLALDIASILAGGWGIARSLLAKSTKVVVRTVVEANKNVIFNLTKKSLILGGIETADILVATASIAYKLANGGCTNYNDCSKTPPQPGSADYAAYQRCQAIEKFLFALEILTLSGDVVARRFFRKATKELKEILPVNNPFPENVISTAEYTPFLNKITDLETKQLDDFINDFLVDTSDDIKALINNLSESEKYAFKVKFADKSEEILTLLKNDGLLIDRWKQFYLKGINDDTASLLVLTNQKLFNDFIEVINKGHITPPIKIKKSGGSRGKNFEIVRDNSDPLATLKDEDILFKALQPNHIDEIEAYVDFMNKTEVERIDLINTANNSLLGENYAFTTNKTIEVDGVSRTFEVTKDPPYSGAAGICVDLANTSKLPNGRFGNGKTFNDPPPIDGLNETEYNRILTLLEGNSATVKVNVTSFRDTDFKNCWLSMGVNPNIGETLRKKLDLTWHHLDDLDASLKSSFQLSRVEIHRKLTHTGSNAQIRSILGLTGKR
ncbi:HNH endonuclease [Polaribacter batillariae]|uniref:HNH endonuclease n=1 Tax=Polaribacter batillariae TaxID=2808900 RepID=A0ABX7SXN7_9FLAO|nr:HNH endonuclease [Polaribacter batillariae]QTD39017.1 HNH endonuclease [Polaribacter batillariae]